MSNSYFQFKQFKIEQGSCAMKVSTDACIQGAWTPITQQVHRVLDIGTGTGLLSLMLAQRATDIQVDAVELDANAAIQAVDNVSVSPWSSRVSVYQADIKNYAAEEQYDMIIVNPPFFQNDLKGEQASRNMARHNDSLSYEDLFSVLEKWQHEEGYSSVLLPTSEFEQWEQLLNSKGWSVFSKLLIKPRATRPYNRVVGLCKKGALSNATEELCIYGEEGYTERFKELLKPFYLHL